MITKNSSKICQPRLMIDEAIALLQDAISCIESQSQDDIEDNSNSTCLLPSLQFTLCQLKNLCVQKTRRRYNTITQIVALKSHLISSTCYNLLQSLESIALPRINTIHCILHSDWIVNFLLFLNKQLLVLHLGGRM